MKEILKVGAVVVFTAGMVTLSVVKHKDTVPTAPAKPDHTQLQLQAANQRISNLEDQLTQFNAVNTTQKADLCTYIQQHINTKTTPLPTDCQ